MCQWGHVDFFSRKFYICSSLHVFLALQISWPEPPLRYRLASSACEVVRYSTCPTPAGKFLNLLYTSFYVDFPFIDSLRITTVAPLFGLGYRGNETFSLHLIYSFFFTFQIRWEQPRLGRCSVLVTRGNEPFSEHLYILSSLFRFAEQSHGCATIRSELPAQCSDPQHTSPSWIRNARHILFLRHKSGSLSNFCLSKALQFFILVFFAKMLLTIATTKKYRMHL